MAIDQHHKHDWQLEPYCRGRLSYHHQKYPITRHADDVPLRMTQLRQLLMKLSQSWSHIVKVRLQRWTYLVEEMVWLRPIGCDDGVRWAPPHEVIRHDRQAPVPQGRGKVVFLRATPPRPIRDGPMRRQCWRGGRLGDDDREAA